MVSSAVMEQDKLMPEIEAAEHSGQLAVHRSSSAEAEDTKKAIIKKMLETAEKHTRECGLSNAALKVKDNTVVMANAPFCGEAVICSIKDNEVVPLF